MLDLHCAVHAVVLQALKGIGEFGVCALQRIAWFIFRMFFAILSTAVLQIH